MSSSPSITIRRATLGDIPAITAIYGHWVANGTASFELEPPDEAEMGRRFETITAAGYPYLVAEQEGRIAGYSYASAWRPRRAYRASVEDSIYVAPDMTRTGTGRLLLAELIRQCEALGYRQMVAVIGDSGQAPSIELHRAAGFTMVGVLKSIGFKHGRWLDGVLMQRALGEGDTTPLEAWRDGL
jgi:phosphinothricin acetyltransferase